MLYKLSYLAPRRRSLVEVLGSTLPRPRDGAGLAMGSSSSEEECELSIMFSTVFFYFFLPWECRNLGLY